MKPTDNMQAFMDANIESPVCYGEVVHNEAIYYRLDDGRGFVLTNEDIKSAPDFTPDWGFD